jgi:hypothetical protein
VIDVQDLEPWLAPIALVMCIVGALLVTGVRRRWRWLVDPPASSRPVSGPLFIKNVWALAG